MMCSRRNIDSKLNLGKGDDTQENLCLILLNPSSQLWWHSPPFEHGQQICVQQEAHLKGSRCRMGGWMGLGQRANCMARPMAPRRLAPLGVRMMLFLLSRRGRTST